MQKNMLFAILCNMLFWTFLIAAFVFSTNLFYTAAMQLLSQPQLTQALATKNTANLLAFEPRITQTQTLFLLSLTLFLFLFFCGLFSYAIMIQQFVQKNTKQTLTSALLFSSKTLLFFLPFTGSFFIGNHLLPTLALILTILTLTFFLPAFALTTLTHVPFLHALKQFFHTLPFFILILFILLFLNSILFLLLPFMFALIFTFITFIFWNTWLHQNYTTHTCAHK